AVAGRTAPGHAAVDLDRGQPLRLTIPLLGQAFEIDGCVAWCRPTSDSFEVGVRFLSPQDRFNVRMVEQLCYIEDYRQQVAREEGRSLSSEQAAEEWIERFAEHFPGLH
ncbi:MAG: PilZ domain-containing protein, partial [Gammaproteobacteria bacterium]|nr:PilZ domain-containing protein [Gammaproteobacteria bacterium]